MAMTMEERQRMMAALATMERVGFVEGSADEVEDCLDCDDKS